MTSAGSAWQPGRNLGPAVNTKGYEDNATVSSDGRRLLFSRTAAGGGGRSADVYEIAIEALEVDLGVEADH